MQLVFRDEGTLHRRSKQLKLKLDTIIFCEILSKNKRDHRIALTGKKGDPMVKSARKKISHPWEAEDKL